VHALAAAIVRVLRDRELSERLAARGPIVAKRFDVRDCTARVDDVYDALRAGR